MQRPPRTWGLWAVGVWMAIYAISTAIPFQWSAILLAVFAFIAAILLLLGGDGN